MTASSSKSPQTSPEPKSATKARKRKQSDDEDIKLHRSDSGPPKKTAHNMIEKRYRNNLNDKIAALRDSVPSLRVMARSTLMTDGDDEEEDLEGLAPAHKLNKATVLAKATEYIQHLEKRNKKLQDEVDALKARNGQLEKLAISAPIIVPSAVSTPDGLFQEEMFPRTPTSAGMTHAPQGMIPLPESIANLRRPQVQQSSYATTQAGYAAYSHPAAGQYRTGGQAVAGGGRHGGVRGRLMVGSLAGLMLLEGFSRRDNTGDEVEAKGLFALPISLFSHLFEASATGGASGSPLALFGLLKLVAILSGLVYVVLPLLDFKRNPKKSIPTIRLPRAPSLASPVEYRQKAWLTAIQTVWVPRHSFVLELWALFLKALKLSTRTVIGWNGYAFLTGATKEQEAARVHAWEIALDAQLTGGDAEISMSRLILTLLASGTLPDTPARLMLKALHIRVLFWEIANLGYGTWYMVDDISAKLARKYWNAARKEHKIQSNNPSSTNESTDALPAHLATLLELECDDVVIDTIVERAYNLAWNRPRPENASGDESMDSVVEDFAITSPLDALAAWWSSFVTNRVLAHSLDSPSDKVKEALADDLELAIRAAPANSFASIRAIVARAVLSNDNRNEHIRHALAALPEDASNHQRRSLSPTPALINVIGEKTVPVDVKTALTLAKCLALSESAESTSRMRAAAGVNGYFPTNTSYSLLSFVASLQILDSFSSDPTLLSDCRPAIERIASTLRIWIGSGVGKNAGLQSRTRACIVRRCLSISKVVVGLTDPDDESDAGYVSQSEDAASVPEITAR